MPMSVCKYLHTYLIHTKAVSANRQPLRGVTAVIVNNRLWLVADLNLGVARLSPIPSRSLQNNSD